MGVENAGRELLGWYGDIARPAIQRVASDRIEALDAAAKRVDRLTKVASEEVPICLLGAAGVGKSTLINAIVSPEFNVLPHGGVGALTAQATVVRYAERPYLRVRYFSWQQLDGIRLNLENAARLAATQAGSAAPSPERCETESPSEELEVTSAEDASAPGVLDRVDTFQRQVRLMIQGNQLGPIDLPYLVDGLRLVLGQEPRWGRVLDPADAARVARIRTAVTSAVGDSVHYEVTAQADRKAFIHEVREHASGFLAPLIKELELGWNAPVLQDGLVLVDLPGIGVANDEYRKVTHHWVRERARAILLVVDRSGVGEGSAELLSQTGFLVRLLHDGDAAFDDPVLLSLVMVKLDSSADSAWRDDRDLNGPEARKWSEHFAEARQRGVETVKHQLRQELEKLSASRPDATLADRQAVLTRLLETVSFHAVSAPQFRLLHLKDTDDPPRIRAPEESGIPQLAEALRSTVVDHRTRVDGRAAAAIHEFAEQIRTTLELVRAQWEQDTRADDEARKLAEDLDLVLIGLRKELDSRHGGFREFLRNSIPEQIDARVSEAAAIAQTDIAKYLKRLGDLHWATLRATVRRGGAFTNTAGKHLDLPNELTNRFEEPVAVVWSKNILTALRKRTSELGDDYVQLVAKVVAWARQEEKRVQPRVVEALHQSLSADTKHLAHVGKEAIDELKKKVRAQLYSRLEKKVRTRCEQFVAKRSDEGPGVKRRILGLFHDELAEDVIGVARPVAQQVLAANYEEVQQEITTELRKIRNPLDRAREALVTSHEDSVRRSDAQRRQKVLEEIEAVLAKKPKGSQ